jgi:hypothetical protein
VPGDADEDGVLGGAEQRHALEDADCVLHRVAIGNLLGRLEVQPGQPAAEAGTAERPRLPVGTDGNGGEGDVLRRVEQLGLDGDDHLDQLRRNAVFVPAALLLLFGLGQLEPFVEQLHHGLAVAGDRLDELGPAGYAGALLAQFLLGRRDDRDTLLDLLVLGGRRHGPEEQFDVLDRPLGPEQRAGQRQSGVAAPTGRGPVLSHEGDAGRERNGPAQVVDGDVGGLVELVPTNLAPRFVETGRGDALAAATPQLSQHRSVNVLERLLGSVGWVVHEIPAVRKQLPDPTGNPARRR